MTTTITAPAWWVELERRVSATDPSFAHRPQQAAAATMIDLAIRGRSHAAIDLPTGSGKSWLSLAAAQNAHGRTVISTATKALQSQLRDRDIPTMQAVGVLTRDIVVLEGRGNYACLSRAKKYAKKTQPASKKVVGMVTKHLEANPAPEFARRDRMPMAVADWIWSQICSDGDSCEALNCKKGKHCAYSTTRELARSADIVVVNHSLLLADAAIKGGSGVNWGKRPANLEEGESKPAVLGPYQQLILDEAHALENAAESFGEVRVTVRGVQALMSRVAKQEYSGAASRHLEACMDEIRTGMLGLPTGSLLGLTAKPMFKGAADAADQAGKALRGIAGSSYDDAADGEILVSACYGLRDRLRAIDKALTTGSDDFGPRAVSVESPAKYADPTGIKSQLVDAAPWLQKHVFNMVTTVAMSGTLAVPGRRDWVTTRIGLDARVEMLPTSFDLRSQRLVYVTPRVEAKGAVSMARSTDADVVEIQELVKASRGRALVLFPAVTDLRFVKDRLRIDHAVLAQGITADGKSAKGDPIPVTNAELARRFTDDTHSVLLATRSFFEGVDFPGEACSVVIIVRFPNLRPDDPLTLARRQLIEGRGGNAWVEYQEPAMQLVFLQAAGRAIRRVTDKGVVAVIDPRSGSKQYAKTALKSLAPSDYTDKLSDVRDFLR